MFVCGFGTEFAEAVENVCKVNLAKIFQLSKVKSVHVAGQQ